MLLDLVHQKCQHHEHGENHRQMKLAMAEIAFAMIPLVLECIERLIFNLPTRPPAAHQPLGIFDRHGQVRHPGKAFPQFAVGAVLRVMQIVDAQIPVGFIERHIVDERNLTANLAFPPS